MPLWLVPLLSNKYVRYAGAALAVLVLLWAIRAHFINQGKEEGKAQAADELTRDNETQRAADRARALTEIHDADERAGRAQAAFAAAVEREAQLGKVISQLSGQRAAASDHVAKVADPELHSYVVAQLKVRDPHDATPSYTIAEERKIAQVVTDYPLLEQTAAKQQQQMDEIRGQVTELGHKVDAQNQKYGALVDYTKELERDYAQLYNAFPRKRNWFLRLVGVKPKKIPVPDPKELTGKRPS